jgi:hypothetical protein
MPTDHQGRFLTGVLSALWGRVPKPGLPSKRSFCTAMVQWCCFSANSTLHWLQGVNKQRCSCPNGILRHSPKDPKFHKDHERARVEKERICQSCFQSSQRSMLEWLLGKLDKFDRVGLQVPSEVSVAHPAALYNVRRRPSADRRSA